MKKILSIIVIMCCMTATFAAKPDSLSLKNRMFVLNTKSAEISLSYPQIEGSAVQKYPLTDSLNRAVFTLLSSQPPLPYNGKVFDAKSLELFCVTISTALAEFGRKASFDPIPFRFYSSWWAFGNEVVVSVFIKQYTYAGGAHGYTTGNFLNFNPMTGEMLDMRRNIVDTSRLLDIAAEQFCQERRLPQNAVKMRTGLFCELSELPMPKQMGLSDKGLELYYNQYEIAPYSMGPIEITIPYKYFKAILSDKFSSSRMRSGGSKVYNEKMKAEQRSERKK